MMDIDFDELDKAVSSAINGQPVKPADNNVSSQASSLASKPSITPRPSVKFMDVVPPSSSMKVNVAPPASIAREAATVEPIQSVDTEMQKVEEPAQSFAPAAAVPEDSLSSNSLQPQPMSVDSSEPEDADIDRITNEINASINESGSLPETPFLAGAKVEKRPLGAFSDQTQTNIESNSLALASETETTSYASEPILDSGVTEAEEVGMSNNNESLTMPSIDQIESAPIEPVVTQSVSPAPISNEQMSATTTEPAPAVEAQSQPAGPVSITQQYQEKPAADMQEPGSIYDTESYHKAVLKPVAKKSGWKIVLWIILLLLIGAGTGAAVYFFVLPNL
ncbi:hypothetical protein HGB24_02030 [Candidatus Saccharibacteria bacterium]|nr:hypothetical protein [Candidatus Saccharibacteria bacterium]